MTTEMKLAEINGQTGHGIKWDHFNILATGQSDIRSKIKETLIIRDLKPALNENVGSEKLLHYFLICYKSSCLNLIVV